MSKPDAYLYEIAGWSHREVRINPRRPLPDSWREIRLFALSDRDLATGRFADWSDKNFIGECRAQARDQLDPEYSQFMAALADRLEALSDAVR